MGRRRNYPKTDDKNMEDSKSSKPKFSNKKKGKFKGQGYEKTEATNDVNWRIANVKLRTDAANISWSYQTGDTFSLESWNAGPSDAKLTLPGIMTRYEMISPGGYYWEKSAVKSGPANVAANSLLTVMRSKTRVRNTYDAPDLEMVLLAAAEIYAGIAWAKRIYATNLMYSYMNKYLPDALFEAQQIDPSALKADSYAYLAKLNRLITMMNTIYIPDRMPLFQMVTQRYSNYYIEGPSIKDQIYCATPCILRAYDWNPTTDYAGALIPMFITPHDANKALNPNTPTSVKYGTKNATTDELLQCLEGMIVRLMEDSDVPDITGDMQNAFGEGNRFLIPLLAPDTMATPVYDEEFLEMFMNSKSHIAVTKWYFGYDYSTQVGSAGLNDRIIGWVIQNPTTNKIGLGDIFYKGSTRPSHLWGALKDTLLNVHKDPSVDKTVMITRNADQYRCIKVTVLGNDTYTEEIAAVGVMGCGFALVRYDNNGSLIKTVFNTTSDETAQWLLLHTYDTPFHYRPAIYIGQDDGTTALLDNVAGELDIVSTISNRDLDEINRLDMMNMLGAFDNIS